MERTFYYEITQEDLPCTVQRYLRGRGYSHHILASLKPHADAVLRNGGTVRFKSELAAGDVLSVTLRDERPSENVRPAPVPFSIIYEDEDLMVIDKPAGVSIHPAINHPADTLANGIAHLYAQRGIPYVFRCINRLDRDTTGLLILANNAFSASRLETALQHRAIRRTYLALVEGRTAPSGTVDLPIGRTPGSLIERCIDRAHGDRAVTHYERIAETACCSLLKLRLETGRTHQIRVHMAAIGHPLYGDSLYNPRLRTAADEGNPAESRFPRQALHAWELAFDHPVSGAPMHFQAPIPADLAALLSHLSI